MFSMSATAPNSARKNQRRGRATNRDSSSSDSVGGGGDNSNNNDNSFVSPTKGNNNNLATRSAQNNSPAYSLAETTTTMQSPLPPMAPRHSPSDTKRESTTQITPSGASNSLDDRDEESNGQRSSAHNIILLLGNVQNNNTTNNDHAQEVESISSPNITSDTPNDDDDDSPSLQKPTAAPSIITRNDSISANIDELPNSNNHYPRLHVSPKQERCSPEMNKNILSLLEKDGQQQQKQPQQQQQESNGDDASGKTDSTDNKILESQSPRQPHLPPSNNPSNDQEHHHNENSLLSDTTTSTSHHRELDVCRKRLETEESRASTLSANDLLNLQQCCTLSSTSSSLSSSANDNSSNNNIGDSNSNAINEVALVDNKEFRRSCSMEPMVAEGEEDEDELAGGGKAEAVTPHSSPEKGGFNNKNDINPKTTSLPPQPPPPKPSSPLIYRLYNDSPTSPMSEVNSILMGGGAAVQGSPCSSSGITPSLFQENADDDIGGDTYFEEKISPRQQPYYSSSSSPSVDDNERRGGNNDNGVGIDDLMTPLPPPRVNRTKNNPMGCSSTSSTDPTTSSATSIAQQLAGAPSLPIQSPRRQTFTHTHSLLDDCSDEEEHDDDDEVLSSSYVMIEKQSSSRSISSRKTRRSHSRNDSSGSISNSQQMASNNIQIALLQTRHRRWEIQSALCGSHAQSNQVFDLSTRVHHIPNFHNQQQQHFSFSPIRPSMTSDADIDDDGVSFLARLSVPIESIRAGILGSGLSRTVRLVKLPQGLFGWHWLMWKEQRQVPDSVYFGDNMPLDNEVWSLLQMLGETFPHLEQIDFGGDIAAQSDQRSVDSAAYDKEEWRNEILTCIMQCLPKLVAVDGFAVERERGGEEDEPVKSNEDGSIGHVPLNVNDEQRFIKPWIDGQAHTVVGTSNAYRRRSSSYNIPNHCDVATETSDAIEDVSENIMLLCDSYMHSNAHSEENSTPPDHYGPMIESIASEDETKLAQFASSPLASSFSWSSAGSSGARPPPCPKSDTRRRLPIKPTIKSKMKSKLSKKNKRRLKKLTGLLPSMMDDDEDSDDEDDVSTEGEGTEDCPADLL